MSLGITTCRHWLIFPMGITAFLQALATAGMVDKEAIHTHLLFPPAGMGDMWSEKPNAGSHLGKPRGAEGSATEILTDIFVSTPQKNNKDVEPIIHTADP